MDRNMCEGWGAAQDSEEIFECPKCGNHVCGKCACKNNFLCPHCFAKLCGIN